MVRSVKSSDGYEALRQLTLALRPANNNRGLALMSALTSWPAFQMNQPLQAQVLKLEDAMEEARRAGTTLLDQLQQAILLRCVTVNFWRFAEMFWTPLATPEELGAANNYSCCSGCLEF